MTVRLQLEPFDAGALLSAFSAGRRESGAVVSFTGICRADGETVAALELEAYDGFTDVEIAAMAAETKARFALDDVMVIHRIGKIAPGEPIVFVATAAAHRRAAFEGCDQLMDYLKSRAPFWKKSHEAGGARWIDPRAEDYVDAARWDPEKSR